MPARKRVCPTVWVAPAVSAALQPQPSLAASMPPGPAASPADGFEVAVFAINGPISTAPGNFLFVREAPVEFLR